MLTSAASDATTKGFSRGPPHQIVGVTTRVGSPSSGEEESSDKAVRSAFVLSTDFRGLSPYWSFHGHSRMPVAVHLDV